MLANRLDTIIHLGAPRQRSAKTSNLDRIASDLLDDVMQGLRTVHEAAAHYGRWTPKCNGRPRRFPTFADYIADRARYATCPAVEQELRTLLSMMGGPARAQGGRTVRVNRLLAETGADRAARLRDLLAELREHDHAG
jgi:hypothetical protein